MKPIHHVLWTGGFDSTFRICQLLIEQQCEVQPIYVTHMGFQEQLIFRSYDSPNHIQKPAMPHEMQAIANIKALLRQDFPAAAKRLRPIRFLCSRHEPDAWNEAQKVKGPGINNGRQYSLLQLVAKQYKHPIELSIERSPPGHNQVGDTLMPWVVEDENGVYRLQDELPEEKLTANSTESLKNFLSFRFPVLRISRYEMMEKARIAHYQHLLERTWSCREFRQDRKPCGECFCCRGRIRDDVFWSDPLNTAEFIHDGKE